MPSAICELAITDSLKAGKALLKFISANNVGSTGSHECGYYLPKAAWPLYAPFPPEKGDNKKNDVKITWQADIQTDSVVTWYGKGTRSEYRLTRFGSDFPFLNEDCIGNLLILIPVSMNQFNAYVLDTEEDIIEIQATLGVDIVGSWGVFDSQGSLIFENPQNCISRLFRKFSSSQSSFPTGQVFSDYTQNAVNKCISKFGENSTDKQLLRLIENEYRLFRMVERNLCQSKVSRLFKNIDDFLSTAATILNRRKSRAGRSLENHVEYLFNSASLNFDMRPPIDGNPDVIFPSKEAYLDDTFPVDKLTMLGVKTTCKDRWRQVLNEAKRIPVKHLLTLQSGISKKQLDEMAIAKIVLIVPKGLHKDYPAEYRSKLLSIDSFIDKMKG